MAVVAFFSPQYWHLYCVDYTDRIWHQVIEVVWQQQQLLYYSWVSDWEDMRDQQPHSG
jgi:hypothetical protein